MLVYDVNTGFQFIILSSLLKVNHTALLRMALVLRTIIVSCHSVNVSWLQHHFSFCIFKYKNLWHWWRGFEVVKTLCDELGKETIFKPTVIIFELSNVFFFQHWCIPARHGSLIVRVYVCLFRASLKDMLVFLSVLLCLFKNNNNFKKKSMCECEQILI